MWAHLIEGEARDGFGFELTGRVNDIGHQSACVPPALRACELAYRRHATMPWAELLAPAIARAREGWMVRPHVARWWSTPSETGRVANHDRLRHTEGARALYCRADGSSKQPGDTVVNPDLADTLEIIAREGADAFYRGDIAGVIEADMISCGGLLRPVDLEGYAPQVLPHCAGSTAGMRSRPTIPPVAG